MIVQPGNHATPSNNTALIIELSYNHRHSDGFPPCILITLIDLQRKIKQNPIFGKYRREKLIQPFVERNISQE